MSPGVQLHNKLNWINKNTERERFYFFIPFSIINLSQAICSLLYIFFFFFYIFSDLDQFTETSSAVHSKQTGGMSSKEEETASSTRRRKWLIQLIPIVKPQPRKEFSCSNILLHHNDKPALWYKHNYMYVLLSKI